MTTGPALPLAEAVIRLLLVIGLAGLVGLEREFRDQDAGLRTHMLVGLGAALFVIAGNYAWWEMRFGAASGVVLDPSRVVAYVVTGIGFLGAGAIIKNGANVRGLTTAASLWVVAAVGVVVGSGEYWLGVIATATIILSLWPMRQLATMVGLRSNSTYHLSVTLSEDVSAVSIVELVSGVGQPQSIAVDVTPVGQQVEVVFSARRDAARSIVTSLLLDRDGITHLDLR